MEEVRVPAGSRVPPGCSQIGRTEDMCPSDSRVPSGRPQRVKNLAGFHCQVEGWSGEPASTDLPQEPALHSLDPYFTLSGHTFFFLNVQEETHQGTRLKELSMTG